MDAEHRWFVSPTKNPVRESNDVRNAIAVDVKISDDVRNNTNKNENNPFEHRINNGNHSYETKIIDKSRQNERERMFMNGNGDKRKWFKRRPVLDDISNTINNDVSTQPIHSTTFYTNCITKTTRNDDIIHPKDEEKIPTLCMMTPIVDDEERRISMERQKFYCVRVSDERAYELYSYSLLKSHSVLILGEMDFSLSLAVQQKYAPKLLVATAYYTKPPLKKFWENIESVRANQRSFVEFGIDATDLLQSLKNVGAPTKYDRIIFTFPWIEGTHVKKCAFMQSLLWNVVHCLTEPDGELHLMFPVFGDSMRTQYDNWRIGKIANWEKRVIRIDYEHVREDVFPGYQPRSVHGGCLKNPMYKRDTVLLCLMSPQFEKLKKSLKETPKQKKALKETQKQKIKDLMYTRKMIRKVWQKKSNFTNLSTQPIPATNTSLEVSSNSDLNIYIMNVSQQNHSEFQLKLEPNVIIQDIKYLIEKKCGILKHEQILFVYCSNNRTSMQLNDNKKGLSEYNMNTGARIYLSNAKCPFSMCVIIRKLDGTHFILRIERDINIKEIKMRIKNEQNIDIEAQKLFFNKKLLADKCSINDYGIRNMNVLCLILKSINYKCKVIGKETIRQRFERCESMNWSKPSKMGNDNILLQRWKGNDWNMIVSSRIHQI